MDNKKMIESMTADGTIARTSKYYFSQGFEPFKEMLCKNLGREVKVYGYYNNKSFVSKKNLTVESVDENNIYINDILLNIQDVWDIRSDGFGMGFEIFTYGEHDKFYILLTEHQLAAKDYKADLVGFTLNSYTKTVVEMSSTDNDNPRIKFDYNKMCFVLKPEDENTLHI